MARALGYGGGVLAATAAGGTRRLIGHGGGIPQVPGEFKAGTRPGLHQMKVRAVRNLGQDGAKVIIEEMTLFSTTLPIFPWTCGS